MSEVAEEVSRFRREDIDYHHRKMCRTIASMMVNCMAHSDMSFAEIADKLELSERAVRNRFAKLLEGYGGDISFIAQMGRAMNYHVDISLSPREMF